MNNIYLPEITEITKVTDETYDTKTFTLRLADADRQNAFDYRPGCFFEVSVFGVGEAPFGVSSTPTRKGTFDITVRAVGSVTRALHDRKPGDRIGVRGPLGNGFPVEELKGRDLVIIAGGIGLCPLRSFILNVFDQRQDFGKVTILYGARTPRDLVYRAELEEWEQRDDVKFLLTVDQGDAEWKGRVGMVPTLFGEAELRANGAVALVCGPPVMIKFVILDLERMGFAPENIITTLERHMKCGVGKCHHCAIGHKYVCQDGPVFSYQQIQKFVEQV